MIPPRFAEGVRSERGAPGEAWLRALPARIAHYCLSWGLQLEGEPWHGYLGIVFPVLRGRERAVLKLTWVDEETRDEAQALSFWNGQGAVRLLDADAAEGVLLLERLQGDRSLQSLPVGAATIIAARLLRRLARPAPAGLLEMADYAQRQTATLEERWEKWGRPFPLEWVRAAQAVAPPRERLIVNQDLHYDNVLAGEREPWLVVDPKVLCGEVEFGVAPLLWNRWGEDGPAERFERIVESANLDRERARQWALFRCVDYWLWALGQGFTEDPLSCRELVTTLLALKYL